MRDWFRASAESKRRRKSLIQHLSGLPPESKAVLIDFHQNGTHTRRSDPTAPAAKVLIQQGLVKIGPGGGTYDAVDRYLTIVPDVWEVMNDWISADILSINAVTEQFFDRPQDIEHHDQPRKR